jgi:hypothetical protein
MVNTLRFSKIIDDASLLPLAPLMLTQNSRSKAIRVAGVVAHYVWFLPGVYLWIAVVILLAIPAMIQDA